MKAPGRKSLAITLALLALTTVILAADPGETPLLNGKNLDGWKTKSGESLDGKTEAYGNRFKVVEGRLVIDPKVKGDVIITSAKTFAGDVRLQFEFLPGAGCNNDLFLRGMKFDLKKPDVKNLHEGEWNRFEIVVKGEQAEFRNNGELLKTLKPKPGATGLGIRAEFGPVEIRELRYHEPGAR